VSATAASAAPDGRAARGPRARRARLPPLAGYVLRRLGAGLILLVIVSMLVFAATQILPGDAASAILGRSATQQAKLALRHQLGLDRPLWEQYRSWAGGLLRGDFGRSLSSQQPVTGFIADRIWNTLALAGVAVAFMIPLSFVLGIWAGIRRDRAADHVIAGGSLAAIALPEFVIGTVLVALFAVHLQWLPAISVVPDNGDPFSAPSILVLPVITLLVVSLAYTIRMIRAGMVETLATDYVQMARLNGIPERRVISKHALRNALAPSVQVLALTVQWLVGGVVVVETVFGYSGLGQGLVQAVAARDIPVVQAVAILIAAFYILVNIVADVIVILLIPKLRTSL
jgi:peptide/nickel transport system permease protein